MYKNYNIKHSKNCSASLPDTQWPCRTTQCFRFFSLILVFILRFPIVTHSCTQNKTIQGFLLEGMFTAFFTAPAPHSNHAGVALLTRSLLDSGCLSTGGKEPGTFTELPLAFQAAQAPLKRVGMKY